MKFKLKKIGQKQKTFIITVLQNLLLFLIPIIITFIAGEAYFIYYYKHMENTPQTVMNLPIYQKSTYRSWDHKPHAYAQYGYGDPIPEININSLGLRNEEIPEEKTKNRILMLGDSFTFGMGVKQDKTFTSRLQDALGTKYHRVINAGVIGQTIDDAFLYLKYHGHKLKPDYVFYNFFVGNDITELKRHKWTLDKDNNILKTTDKKLTVDTENKLKHRETKAPKSYFIYWVNHKIQILKKKYFPHLNSEIDPTLTWPAFLSEYHPDQDPDLERYWQEFEFALQQMNDFCKERDIEFIISVIPMDVQINQKYWTKYPGMPFDIEAYNSKRPQKRIKQLADGYGIPIFDHLRYIQVEEHDLEFVRKEKNPNFYFKNDPHFNELGHRFVGAYLWIFLMDNYL